jgi:RNA polymerase sigma-70 factor, ECF subfamily
LKTPTPSADANRWAEDFDVQLMLRFQKGDRAAFEELVQRNVSKVHALIYRFLGGGELIEDITQEVFLRIFRTAPRYQPAAKFGTWLYRIVANLSFNVLRDRRKGQLLQWEAPSDQDDSYRDVPDEDAPMPQQDLDASELAQRVAAAIDALPENQKIAIILNKYEHKNYEEIAGVLECSTMAVKSLLSRARTNLRQALGRYVRP